MTARDAGDAIETAIAMVRSALQHQEGTTSDRGVVETLLLELELNPNVPLVASALAVVGAAIASEAGSDALPADQLIERAARKVRGTP
jgi:hypothetical protein